MSNFFPHQHHHNHELGKNWWCIVQSTILPKIGNSKRLNLLQLLYQVMRVLVLLRSCGCIQWSCCSCCHCCNPTDPSIVTPNSKGLSHCSRCHLCPSFQLLVLMLEAKYIQPTVRQPNNHLKPLSSLQPHHPLLLLVASNFPM